MTDPTPARPSILFACKANAGRSVTGKVLAQHYGGAAVEVYSAGSSPGDHIHPEVAAVLAELGLSTDDERPKGFDVDGRYSAVITMGCGDECPLVHANQRVDWQIPDPRDMSPQEFLKVCDLIETKVKDLIDWIGIENSSSISMDNPIGGTAETM